MNQPPDNVSPAIATAAAQWLARRDRALSAQEQDEYLQWLREDPRHAAAMARQEGTLERLMQLGAWQPVLRDEPNPDLFAPVPRRPRRPLLSIAVSTLAAAAAALAVIFWPASTGQVERDVPKAEKSYLRVNERQALDDGSLVELKDGSRITVEFTPEFRRVHLTGGEACFTVAKDPNRPFIVEAAGMEVHAVGTVFNVRLDLTAVEVLVTEGKVRLNAPMVDAGKPAPLLAAGERAILPLAGSAAPQVTEVTSDQIHELLSWQTPRLQFYETPLKEAVAEFNRYAGGPTATRLVIGQVSVGEQRIGGTFRIDNREGFVRVLEMTADLNIRSRKLGNGDIVLVSAR